MFLLGNEEISIILLLCTLVPIAILIVLAFVLRIKNSKLSKSKISNQNEEVDEEQKSIFIEAYGGKENIVSVNIERNKIYVKVNNIDEVNGEKLKELGAENVLLIGDEVRSSFGDRAQNVYKLLK